MMMLTTGSRTAVAALPPTAAAAPNRELKFTLPAGRVDLARRWLETVCRRDSEHPAAVVWTIYYDTPHLAALGEKINSDYLKLKVRLRWYSEIGRAPSGPAFVEAKMRTGTRRAKERIIAPYTGDDIAGWNLQDHRLRPLPYLLRERGVALQGCWEPMLLLRYRRDRFLEPVSRARVSLDSEIAAAAINPRYISTFDPSPLEIGILEVKGGEERLPDALRPLLQMGARKRSFSKFLAVYRHLARSAF